MNFKFENNTVSTTCNKNVEVGFYFTEKTDHPAEVYIEGTPFVPSDECLDGLYVGIDDKVVSIKALMVKAIEFYQDCQEEQKQEGSDYKDHIKSMSHQSRYV